MSELSEFGGLTHSCDDPDCHVHGFVTTLNRMSAEMSEFIGSVALLDALHETYVQHIAISEPDGPDGPYLWCVCGWRSDDLDGRGTRSDNPGMSYAVHLTNAQHAAAVEALQPIVRRVTAPGVDR